MSISAPTLGSISDREVGDEFTVLGIRFHAIQIPDVIRTVEGWIEEKISGNCVCVSNVHSVIEARFTPVFKKVLNSAALCVPDGMPIVWLGRYFGFSLRRRVYGPDLLLEFFRSTQSEGYRHFFYGGAPGIPEALAKNLMDLYPGVRIVGVYSPPFRSLSISEDTAVVEMINRADPDVLWVGLGCPKQEMWMHEHRERLNARAIVGIGQAFAIHAGALRQAPEWMRDHGLEWLFRLLREPGRLWKRYLVYNSMFLVLVMLQLLHIKKGE